MTIHVTAFQLLTFGFLCGVVCGLLIAAYVFYAKVRRALGRFQQNLQRTLSTLGERVPQLTATVGQLGVSAALVQLATGVVNDLTRGVGRKVKARAERQTIGFQPQAKKESADGR